MVSKLNDRIKKLKKLDLFSEEILKAIEEVRDYVKKMDDDEYYAYVLHMMKKKYGNRRPSFFD